MRLALFTLTHASVLPGVNGIQVSVTRVREEVLMRCLWSTRSHSKEQFFPQCHIKAIHTISYLQSDRSESHLPSLILPQTPCYLVENKHIHKTKRMAAEGWL